MITVTQLVTLAVVLATWSSPAPAYTAGRIVLYGRPYLVQANADYRGYDMQGFKCGGALISPVDLGKIFWVRVPGGEWWGPCLSVDCGARVDFYNLVVVKREVAEVDVATMAYLGKIWSVEGEVAVSPCPPKKCSTPQPYKPQIQFDYADPQAQSTYSSYFWPYPKQQHPVDCVSYEQKRAFGCVTEKRVFKPESAAIIRYCSRCVPD